MMVKQFKYSVFRAMTTVEHKRMSSSSSDETSKNTPDKAVTSSPSSDATAAPTTTPPTAVDPETTSRFAGAGVDFKGKLIGIEEVADPRGDKMCQVAMAKLKAGVKATGDHKQRITINVSLEGVKIIDEKSTEVLHSHEVSRISFIARDSGDSRAFGYVFRRKEGSHQFFGIKTERAAEGLVVSLRDLFQTVYEIKKKQSNETKSEPETQAPHAEAEAEAASTEPQPPPPATTEQAFNQLIFDVDINGFSNIQPSNGLTPSFNIFDPFVSPPPPHAVQSQQQPFNPLPGNSPFFPQMVQPTSMPPTMMMSPFQSPGNAYVNRPGVPIVTGSAQGIPGAVSWPSGMMTTPAAGATPMGTQWVVPGGGSGLVAAPHDPFAALAQSPSQGQGQGTAPLIPARRVSPNNPFSGPTTTASPAARPDPFAELAMLSGAGSTSAGYPKKTDKKDFFQEPPKPSLFDLTQQQVQQQQQQQQFPTDLFGSTPFSNHTGLNDPFA